MMGVLQPWHLIVVLVIVMMVLGPGKLPELGRAVGDGLRELKRSTSATEAPRTNAAAAAPVMAGLACRGCATDVPAGSRFCGACGLAQAVALAA